MKPLRPFPFPINIGTDICQISRIYGILTSPRGLRFVNRVLAPEEAAREFRRKHHLNEGLATLKEMSEGRLKSRIGKGEAGDGKRDGHMWEMAAFVAGRFAAKEAVMKAHSHRRLTFHDITIERRGGGEEEDRLGSGPPIARIAGGSGRGADEDEDEDVSAVVSISHDGDYATATCIGYDPGVIGRQA